MTAANDPMFNAAPRIVIWEMTRACALACLHCRAEAIPRRDPNELTTAEAFALAKDVAECGPPLFVLTGGDPLMRDDIYKIVEYGSSLGIHMAISPSATGRLTRDAIRRLAVAGARTMSLSIDAPDAEAHDAFRGVKGSFKRTIDAIGHAREFGIGVQINTSVSTMNHERLAEFIPLLEPFEIQTWSLFFVLPVGRATDELCLNANQMEDAFRVIYRISSTVPYWVKTTEAPHYRRYVMQHETVPPRERETAPAAAPSRFSGISDGKGFVFISHHGEIQPSGFLQLTAGNVKNDRLIDIYRNHRIFQRLRDPDTFAGKCGVCEFRRVCGGSRARAFAVDGKPFGSDPACAYVPAAFSAVAT